MFLEVGAGGGESGDAVDCFEVRVRWVPGVAVPVEGGVVVS